MTEKMDMSLDDIIKKDGISARRPGRGAGAAGRGAGGRKTSPMKSASGAGGSTRFQGRARGNAPYSRVSESMELFANANTWTDTILSDLHHHRHHDRVQGPVTTGKWQHDRFAGGRGAASSGGPAHLLVSNLDYGVNDKDIRELFSEFGSLKKAAVHYDKSGRSLGTADVTYVEKAAAIKAMKQYNGVPLDGRPMKIEMAASTITPAPAPRASTSRPAAAGAGGRGGRGGRGGAGNAGGRQAKKPVTQEELDADLDAFISNT